jgi:hypothetical protein
MLAVVPTADSENLVELARLADEYYVSVGAAPKEVVLFEYEFSAQKATLAIKRGKNLPGSTLYSSAAGFREQTVHDTHDLADFLAANLDLVYAERRGADLVLGGRAQDPKLKNLMSLNDVADIFQASKNLDLSVTDTLRRRGMQEEYYRFIDKQIADYIAQHPETNWQSSREVESLREAAYDALPYDRFESQAIEAAIKVHPPSLGFSLDPRNNHRAVASDLAAALDHNKSFLKGAAVDIYAREAGQESILVGKELKKLLEYLESAEPAAGDESHSNEQEQTFSTLVGTEKIKVSEASVHAGLPKIEGSDAAREERKVGAHELQLAVDALSTKKEVVQQIVKSLNESDVKPLIAFERYLNSDSSATVIRPDSPKYQILDLQEMLNSTGYSVTADGSLGPDTKAKVQAYQQSKKENGEDGLRTDGKVDQATWKLLLADCPEKQEELENIRIFLNVLETKNNYQCARYDGALQGTEVGMTMFYTDLLMKLWSFEYQGSNPKVEGFSPETTFPISAIYWAEVWKYPATRGWLGGKSSSIEISEDGNAIRFAPIATRLYSASSNPLVAGYEVPANFMSDRFSSWWNAHYADVANFEPQYLRLNQIMKWTAVVEAFAGPYPAALSSLSTVAVDHSKRFDTWWSSRSDLKVKVQVPFETPSNETTECMAIIESEPFFGLGTIAGLSGGVSGFKQEEIDRARAVAMKRAEVPEELRSSALDYEAMKVTGDSMRLPVGGVGSFELRTESAEFVPTESFKMEGSTAYAGLARLDTKFSGTADNLIVAASAPGSKLYELSVEAHDNAIQLKGDVQGLLKTVEFLEADSASTATARQEMNVDVVALDSRRSLIRFADAPDWAALEPVEDADRYSPLTNSGELTVRVAMDDSTVRLSAASAADLSKVRSVAFWEELRGAKSGPAASKERFVTATDPESDSKFKLYHGDRVWDAQLSDSGVYVKRIQAGGPEPTDAESSLQSALDESSLERLISIIRDSQNGRIGGVRTSSKNVVLASLGSDPNVAESSLAAEILRSSSGDAGIVVAGSEQQDIRFVSEGVLEVPANLSGEDKELAVDALKIASAHPELRADMARMTGRITKEDVAVLAKAENDEAEAYVELRTLDKEDLGIFTVADVRISPEYRRTFYRKQDQIGIIPVDNPQALREASSYAEALMDGGFPDDTIAQAMPKLRPIYEQMRRIAEVSGSDTIVTMEAGKYDVGAIMQLFGNGPRIVRDIPQIKLSLSHARKSITPDMSRSVFLSTVRLDSPDVKANPSLNKTLEDLETLLIRFNAPLTWTGLQDVLDDESVGQVTLVIRQAGEGLVFSDGWVAFSEIADYLSGIKSKEALHLITNGGTDVLRLFADSGKFNRVILTHFDEGSVESFGTAIENLLLYHQQWVVPQMKLTKDQFEEWRSRDTLIAQELSTYSSPSPDGSVVLDLKQLMAAIRSKNPEVADNILEREGGWMSEHLVTKPQPDLDAAIAAVRSLRIGSQQSFGVRKASLQLRAIPIVKGM